MATAVVLEEQESRVVRARPAGLVHLAWFAAGSVIAFMTPFVFTSVFEVQHDAYYGIYFAIVLAFLGAYARATRLDVVSLFQRAWRWSLVLALPAGAFVIVNVISRDSTPRPEGLYAAFEVVWRGAIYGAVDGLLLTAFPGAVALSLVGVKLSGVRRRAVFAVVALSLTLVITGTYHLGYEQFREDGIGPPEIGNSIISVPLLATGNPLGSVVVHSSMHVTADIHAYETDVFLPPQTEAP
jgi:hypothetical protein